MISKKLKIKSQKYRLNLLSLKLRQAGVKSILLILCIMLSATQVYAAKGRIVDENTGQPMGSFTFKLNDQDVSTDQDGLYNAVSGELDEYLFEFQDGRKYLFLTSPKNINFQLKSQFARPVKKINKAKSPLKLTIKEDGEIVEKAEVDIVSIVADRQLLPLKMPLRNFNQGVVEHRGIYTSGLVYVLITIEGKLYIEAFKDVVPGQAYEGIIDLAAFRPVEGVTAVAYRNSEGAYALLGIESDGAIYLSGNVLPVFLKEADGLELFCIGQEAEFPQEVKREFSTANNTVSYEQEDNYYNLIEIVYRKDGDLLVVYTDQPKIDINISKYGTGYELVSVTGHHVPGFNLTNFSQNVLKDVKNFAVMFKKEIVKEESPPSPLQGYGGQDEEEDN